VGGEWQPEGVGGGGSRWANEGVDGDPFNKTENHNCDFQKQMQLNTYF
jgi:hypothetical protein